MRIAFNIFVRNTDDHPRNHGFLCEPEGLALAPLFDVVPTLARSGVGSEYFLAMGIGREGRLASGRNLCSSAAAFGLTPSKAKELVTALRSQIASTWRVIFSEAGFSEQDLALVAPSLGDR